MPINGRRIDELPTTSGAVLQSDDLIHIIDSVAGGYTNKKISVGEMKNHITSDLEEDIISLSSLISAEQIWDRNGTTISAQNAGDDLIIGNIFTDGDIIPITADTYTLGTSALRWKDLFISSGSVYFDDQKLSINSSGDVSVNDIVVLNQPVTTISTPIFSGLVLSGDLNTNSDIYATSHIYGGTQLTDTLQLHAYNVPNNANSRLTLSNSDAILLYTDGVDSGSNLQVGDGVLYLNCTNGFISQIIQSFTDNGVSTTHTGASGIINNTIGNGKFNVLYGLTNSELSTIFELINTGNSIDCIISGGTTKMTIQETNAGNDSATIFGHTYNENLIGNNVFVKLQNGNFSVYGDEGVDYFRINTSLLTNPRYIDFINNEVRLSGGNSLYFDDQKIHIESGYIYINDLLYSTSTQLSAISGWDGNDFQILLNSYGDVTWDDTIDATDYLVTLDIFAELSAKVDQPVTQISMPTFSGLYITDTIYGGTGAGDTLVLRGTTDEDVVNKQSSLTLSQETASLIVENTTITSQVYLDTTNINVIHSNGVATAQTIYGNTSLYNKYFEGSFGIDGGIKTELTDKFVITKLDGSGNDLSSLIDISTSGIYLTGGLYVNNQLFTSATPLSAISGFNANAYQSLNNVSGDTLWEDNIIANDYFVLLTDFNVLSAKHDLEISNITNSLSAYSQLYLTLDTFDPTPSNVEIDFNGTGAYEYYLSGTTAFSVINATSSTVKTVVALLSSSAITDISATFDPMWYWVGSRPSNDLITITSGAMVELVVRSSGTKIIAAYENIV